MELVLFKVNHKGEILSVVDIQDTHYAVKENNELVLKEECEVLEDTDLFRGLNASGERENILFDQMSHVHLKHMMLKDNVKEKSIWEDIRIYLAKINSGTLTEEELQEFENKYPKMQ